MIKLTKGPEPEILLTHGAIWTETIVSKLAANDELTNAEKTRYRHPQIKASLISETSGKCAYCESKVLHIHHGDVEHVVPKSLRPELTVEWDNLTLACEICNQNKSNHDPYAEHIIDPYVAEPTDHLMFAGALVLSKGSVAGTSTRTIIDLNRGELSERRKERLQALINVYEQIMRDDLPMATRKALYQNLLQEDVSPSAPYSAMANALVEQMKAHLPDEITSTV